MLADLHGQHTVDVVSLPKESNHALEMVVSCRHETLSFVLGRSDPLRPLLQTRGALLSLKNESGQVSAHGIIALLRKKKKHQRRLQLGILIHCPRTGVLRSSDDIF